MSRSARLLGFHFLDGHVEYQLKISRPEGESWELQKRYSQMRDLHDLLKLRIPAINSVCPFIVFIL